MSFGKQSYGAGSFGWTFDESGGAVIASITETVFASDVTSHAVAMPATLNAGDGIIVFLTTDGDATVTTPAGWRRLYNEPNGTALRGTAYARVSRGTEGGTTVDFVTSVAETAAAQVYRITNWSGSLAGIQAAPAGEITAGTTADPPSLTAYWGSAKNLWLASVHTSTTQTVSSAPTNYTDLTQTTSGSGTTHAQCITARRAVETATEDPGVFTMSGSGASKVYSTVSIAPAGFAPQYEHFEITRGTTLWVGMYVSQPHTVADAAITRAIIVCHGSGLDAAEYANVVNSAMSANLGEAVVLTPFFSEGDDPEADQIFWGSSWDRLGLSDASLAWRISSGEVLDELITHLHATFVNLEGVVIAGHSAGGQLVTRYSACSTATDNRYLVSAPSSYMYPGAERTDGAGGWLTPTTPTTYDDYKYGTQNLASISYVNAIGAVALRSRLESAKVHYLVGALDNDPADTSMDLSAEAALQGAHRVERQELFVDYLPHYYGVSLPNHVLVAPVAGVGHEINGVLASADAVSVYMQSFGAGDIVLTVNDISQGQLIDNFVLTQANVLAVADTDQSQAADNIVLSQANVLAAADTTQSQSIDNIDLVQAHTLSVAESSQSQSVDNITLTQSGSLSVAGTDQAQSIDNIDLMQANVISVADSAQSQTSDHVALTQQHTLSIADSSQSQSVDNITLSSSVILTLQDIGQAQLSDNIDLIQQNVLAIQDINQSQIVDNITLASGILLVLADSSQSQTSENIGLLQANVLSVADSVQSQTIDAVALIQSHILTVADSLQSQSIDNIALSLSVVLNPDDLTQNQSIDGITLTQAHLLAVQEILQSQSSDNIVLTQNSILAVADITQSQSIDRISWIAVVTPEGRIYAINAENRVYSIN